MSIIHKAILLLGRCVQASRSEGVEVAVTLNELDTRLKMFFPERYVLYAYDANQQCKPGDIILLKKLEEPMTRRITHEVKKIVYPLGDITDPLTGKKVVFDQYRDDMLETERMFAEMTSENS